IMHIGVARWLVSLIACIVASCAATTGAAPKNTIVPLCVVVADQQDNTLQSDGFGAYCSSAVSGGVSAQFASDGTFTFSSGNPGTAGRVANLFGVTALPLHNKWPCDGGADATIKRIDISTWILIAPSAAVCLIEAIRSKTGRITMTHRGRISFPFTIA